MGIAVVVRDAQGRVAAALSKKVLAPLGALDTEVKALEVGVQFAKDIGIQDFILESDSLVLYRAITRLVQPPSFVDSMVLGIQMLCREFRQVSFSHVC